MNFRTKFVGIVIGISVLTAVSAPLVFAASSWSDPVGLTNNSIEDTDPSLSVHNGKAYVAFVRGEGRGSEIYYRTNASGSWGSPVRLTYNSTGDSAPDIAVDNGGWIHVAHLFGNPATGGDNEVVYRTNRSGAWTRTILTNSTQWEDSPSIAVHGGKTHIVYGKGSDRNEIWYATNSSGAWGKTRITDNGYPVEGGSIALLDNTPHLAYTNQMADESGSPTDRSQATLDDEIYFGKKSGGWNLSRITFNSTADAAPDIAVDGQGKVHIVYRSGDSVADGRDYEISYFTNKSGSWKRTKLTNDARDDNYPTIAVNQGKIFVAWQKWDGGILESGDSEIFFRQTNMSTGSWDLTERLTNNGVNDMIPSIAAYAGKAQLVFERDNPDGEIIFRKQP